MQWKRLVVAAVVLPLLYLYITRLSPLFFLILLSLGAVVAQAEFYAMYKVKRNILFTGLFCGLLVLAGVPLYGLYAPGLMLPYVYPAVLMFSFMLITVMRLFWVKDPAASLADIAPVIAGLLYIPLLLLPQWQLRMEGPEWILYLYGCVWAADSVALYVGKGMGRRKLYKEVSPNKTVEGAFGSVIGGALSSVLLGALLLKGPSAPVLLLMGGVIGAVTIVGDLVESMFKRDAGVKDSGTLFPGHGGVLDKIDGVLFAGPVLLLMKLGL
jgi:phosphatidate cytidylyltransferase